MEVITYPYTYFNVNNGTLRVIIVIPLLLGAKTPFVKIVYSRLEHGFVTTIFL